MLGQVFVYVSCLLDLHELISITGMSFYLYIEKQVYVLLRFISGKLSHLSMNINIYHKQTCLLVQNLCMFYTRIFKIMKYSRKKSASLEEKKAQTSSSARSKL